MRGVPDPADARARLIRVAPRGRRVVAASAKVVAEMTADWTAHLGQQRMRQLTEALMALREVTDPYR